MIDKTFDKFEYVEDRKTEIPLEYKKVDSLLFEAKKMIFDIGSKLEEPLFCRIALYDSEEKIKVSEEFHFDFNSQALNSLAGKSVRKFLTQKLLDLFG